EDERHPQDDERERLQGDARDPARLPDQMPQQGEPQGFVGGLAGDPPLYEGTDPEQENPPERRGDGHDGRPHTALSPPWRLPATIIPRGAPAGIAGPAAPRPRPPLILAHHSSGPTTHPGPPLILGRGSSWAAAGPPTRPGRSEVDRGAGAGAA